MPPGSSARCRSGRTSSARTCGKAPLFRWGRVIDGQACRELAQELIEAFDLRCKSMEIPAKLLSGGNMQKLILARTLRREPRFILANQPVRGLDEGAIACGPRPDP